MLGWLQATPNGAKQSRSQTSIYRLPELPIAETTHEYWSEAGFCHAGADGALSPLAWQELKAFGELSAGARCAMFWETVRAMSQAYVNGLNDKSPLSIPPILRGSDD